MVKVLRCPYCTQALKVHNFGRKKLTLWSLHHPSIPHPEEIGAWLNARSLRTRWRIGSEFTIIFTRLSTRDFFRMHSLSNLNSIWQISTVDWMRYRSRPISLRFALLPFCDAHTLPSRLPIRWKEKNNYMCIHLHTFIKVYYTCNLSLGNPSCS
jgi:hypothetical protein